MAKELVQGRQTDRGSSLSVKITRHVTSLLSSRLLGALLLSSEEECRKNYYEGIFMGLQIKPSKAQFETNS